MTEMNEHQKRVWKRMISSIDAYRSSRTGFYDVWGDLEIARAIDGDNVRYAEVDDPLDAMERFLRDKLNDAEGSA